MSPRDKLLIMISFVCIFTISPLSFSSHVASSQDLPKNKVVSLVYDDSGSMWEGVDQKGQYFPIDNWKFANYALQSFVALMDKEDQLSVVYMSSPNVAEPIKLEENLRHSGIEKIRNWKGQQGTPLSSIYTAIGEIEASLEKNQNSDFWLVVLTDGVFNELNHLDSNHTKKEIESRKKDLFGKINQLTKKVVAAGATLRTALIPTETYLNSEEQVMMADFKRQWQENTNAYILESDGQLDIIQQINKVAALMTDRDPEDDQMFQLDPVFELNQLILHSPFPLRRITIIEQSTDDASTLQIKQFSINNKRVEKGIEGPYQIATPVDPYQLNPPIRGSLTHFTNKSVDGIIESGTYNIIFQEPLTEQQKQNIRILAEPAIDYQVNVNKVNADGSLTNDTSVFFADSKMEIAITLLDPMQNEINLRELNVESILDVSAFVDQTEVKLTFDESRNQFIGYFTLFEKENIPIETIVRIKGFYQKQKSLEIHGYPIRKLTLVANQDNWSAPVNQLENTSPLLITPHIDGKEITVEELTEIFHHLELDSGKSKLNFDIQQVGNEIAISPKKKRFLFLTSTGEIQLHVKLAGKYPNEIAEETFPIMIEDISFLKKYGPVVSTILFIILFIIYVVGILIKPRFNRRRIYVESQVTRKNERSRNKNVQTEHFYGSWIKRWLYPYKPERKTIMDLTFKAHTKKDRVYLVKECQEPNMIVGNDRLNHLSGEKDILMFHNDKVKIERGNMITTYTFKSNS